MKILTIVFNLNKGGTQRTAQNFAEAYSILGHDSRLLAYYSGGKRVDELREAGIPIWVDYSCVKQECIKWAPELIHFHSYGLSDDDRMMIVNDFDNCLFIETNVFSTPTNIEDKLTASMQLAEWCSYLYETRRGERKKSTIVANPVKCQTMYRAYPAEVNMFKEKYGIPADAFIIGRVGQAIPKKWSPVLVEQYIKFIKKYSKRTWLLLCGVPDEIISLLKDNPNIKNNYTIIDQINGDDGLRVLYSSIDLFVHIADEGESFGMVLAESLLCETPVVTINTPWADNSQAEVIGRDAGGIVVNMPDEIHIAMLELASDKDRLEQTGKSGRKYILENYDMLDVANKALNTLKCNTFSQFTFKGIYRYASSDKITRISLYLMYIIKRIKYKKFNNWLLRKIVKFPPLFVSN